MRFDFDPKKSVVNQEKHGINFDRAQALWDDEERIDVEARTVGEVRFATIGRIGDEVWIAIWTPRREAIRIISVRRAHENERKLYEEA